MDLVNASSGGIAQSLAGPRRFSLLVKCHWALSCIVGSEDKWDGSIVDLASLLTEMQAITALGRNVRSET
jgi:hypothetical protein